MLPTAATVLAGVGRRHGDDSTPSGYCFGFEDGPELRPARIRAARGQAVVPYHVGDLQVFEIDRVVGGNERERGLVVELPSLPLPLFMRFRYDRNRLPSPVAPL